MPGIVCEVDGDGEGKTIDDLLVNCDFANCEVTKGIQFG